jgi:hypothetical protein
VPGFAVVTTMTVLAASGDITRFASAKKLVGYSGLGAKCPCLRPDASHRLHHTEIVLLNKVHRRVLYLLGPAYENCNFAFQQTAE